MLKKINLYIALSVVLIVTSGCFWLSSSALNSQQSKSVQLAQENMIDQLKASLQKSLKDSRTYFVVEGLPEAGNVRTLIEQTNEPFWEQLSPIENFFAFEIVPEAVDKAPSAQVAQAYCAAVAQLPSDWWGMPGDADTETAEHLLDQPGIQDCLVGLLENTQPLQYLDGEANTLSKMYQWQVSDLAAGFILALSNQEYETDVDPQSRQIVKQQLKDSATE
jgi:hypothetical protein